MLIFVLRMKGWWMVKEEQEKPSHGMKCAHVPVSTSPTDLGVVDVRVTDERSKYRR